MQENCYTALLFILLGFTHIYHLFFHSILFLSVAFFMAPLGVTQPVLIQKILHWELVWNGSPKSALMASYFRCIMEIVKSLSATIIVVPSC